jgi:hypothetical protein
MGKKFEKFIKKIFENQNFTNKKTLLASSFVKITFKIINIKKRRVNKKLKIVVGRSVWIVYILNSFFKYSKSLLKQ